MKKAEERRIYRNNGWEYLLDDEDRTAWINKGHIGRCHRFRVPDHVIVDGMEYTITSIEVSAFKRVKTLRHLVIPDTITYVDEDVFCFQPNLRSIYVGKGVDYLSSWHFRCNAKLSSSVISTDNPHMKVVNNLILSGNGKSVLRTVRDCESYDIPEGVKIINAIAFMGNEKLKSVRMPDSLKYIGRNAFDNCTDLSSVLLNEGLQKIEDQCFYDCVKLENAKLPSTLSYIGHEAFYGCPLLTSTQLTYHSLA